MMTGLARRPKHPLAVMLTAVAMALISASGCGETQDTTTRARSNLELVTPYPVVDSLSLDPRIEPQVTLLHTWGLEDDSPFGIINDATLLGDSLIAVADRVGCAIHLLDIRVPQAPARSVGGCGDGPGEFRNLSSISFDGAALLVVDRGQGRIHRLDASGTLLDPGWLDLSTLSGSLESDVDGVAGVLLAAPARTSVDRDAPTFLVHGWGPEAVPIVSDPEIWGVTTTSVRMHAAGCLASGGNIIVMGNSWIPEVAVIGRGPVILGALRAEGEWVPPTVDGGQSAWRPANALPHIVCSERYAVARFAFNRLADDDAQTREIGLGHIFVLDLERRRALSMDVGGARWPDLGSQVPVALHGRLLLTVQNTFGPVPTVALWEIAEW